MSENIFFVSLPLRIDWSELDLFGHVNNVMFMKYIQSARVNYWEQIGLYNDFLKAKKGPMLVSANFTFKKPLFYPGNIIVKTKTEFIKQTSFGFHHEIFNSKGEMVLEAHDVMVMFDFNRNEKIIFPAHLKIEIEKLEKKIF